MTATSGAAAPASSGSSGPLLPDVLRSEWTKLRSVRSTYWSLLAAAASVVGLSALICSLYVNRYNSLSAVDRAEFNPTSFSLSGIFLAQLAIGVLGVLVITSEFSTGMIRSTFVAVPQRRVVLAAKATTFTAVTVVVGLVSSFAAFSLGQAILSGRHIEAHIGQPGVLRSIIGAGLYLAVLGLLSLGIGAIIRHSAGAMAALFGLLFVLPGVVSVLPSSWVNTIGPYLPSSAGQAIFETAPGIHLLSPWTGFLVFCLYAAVALGVAAVTLVRRDA
jgi:ABC-type transport system involved in multi-copper enzyme maturation permease subunit